MITPSGSATSLEGITAMKPRCTFPAAEVLLLFVWVTAFASVGAAHPQGSALWRGDYVAMGSSYASGPGIGTRAPGSARQCQQSSENYAHLFAKKRHLTLKDVSCGGATTQSILKPWRGLPPQLDAVDPKTSLVTITVGGNDVFWMSNLFAWSCANALDRPAPANRMRKCRAPASDARVDAAFAGLEGNFREIVAGIHQRSPQAKIVFVNYLTLFPASGSCPDRLPLSDNELRKARAVAARLAAVTQKVAQETGSVLVKASDLTSGHDVCSAAPWVYGFEFPASPSGFDPVPYHPKLQTMQSIADALDRTLAR
jgi:lysophospholipase L1-like esterase